MKSFQNSKHFDLKNGYIIRFLIKNSIQRPQSLKSSIKTRENFLNKTTQIRAQIEK